MRKKLLLLFLTFILPKVSILADTIIIDKIEYDLMDNKYDEEFEEGPELYRARVVGAVKNIVEADIKDIIYRNDKIYLTDVILEEAFEGCTSLSSIIIPATVRTIANGALTCPSLKSIKVSDDNEEYWSDGIALYYKYFAQLIRVPVGVSSFTIPTWVTDIGGNAFSGCTSLTSITIPNSVTSIGQGAFSGCTSLSSITIPNSVTSIEEGAFDGCTSLTSVIIPNSVTSIESRAFEGCTSLTSIDIPNSVTSIGESAFSGCTSLTSITIPNSVTSIGDSAFSGCTSLSSITIPNSITSIGSLAFSGCSAFYSINLPHTITEIGDMAFYGCASLTSVTIPNSVNYIGYGAFAGCTSLPSILVAPDNPEYSSDGLAIYNKDKTSLLQVPGGLLDFNVPNSVILICDQAFEGCSLLKSVKIPNSVTRIHNNAFKRCTSLLSIALPNSVLYIGQGAFSECYSLESITIPPSVTYIDTIIFEGCSSLSSADFYCKLPQWYCLRDIPLNCRVRVLVNQFQWASHEFGGNLTTLSLLNPTIDILEQGPTTLSLKGACKPEYNILIKKNWFEGEREKDSLLATGLTPDKEYEYSFLAEAENGFTEIISKTVKTSSLMLNTLHPAKITQNTATLSAETNISVLETNVGFMYGKVYSQDNLPPNEIICPISNGKMECKIENLDYGSQYLVKAFYRDASGKYYYGQEKTFHTAGGTHIEEIGDAAGESVEVIGYFDQSGRRYSAPQRGFNIVVYSNGKTEKIFLKD